MTFSKIKGHRNRARTNESSSHFVMNSFAKEDSSSETLLFINMSTGALSLKPPLGVAGRPYEGILAGEIGLEKTIQCLAYNVHEFEKQTSTETSIPEANEDSD